PVAAVAHVAAASWHGSGSTFGVTAIVTGPESVRSSDGPAKSASVSGNGNASRRSPRSTSRWVASRGSTTHVADATPGAASQLAVSTPVQSLASATTRLVPSGALKTSVTTSVAGSERKPVDPVSQG